MSLWPIRMAAAAPASPPAHEWLGICVGINDGVTAAANAKYALLSSVPVRTHKESIVQFTLIVDEVIRGWDVATQGTAIFAMVEMPDGVIRSAKVAMALVSEAKRAVLSRAIAADKRKAIRCLAHENVPEPPKP